MAAPHRYPIPADRARAEEVIDRSRFICSIARAETAADAQAFIREISAEYPDATHHCWAYVAGPPGSDTHIGMSDDGEPHGTAGRPMLTVLLHANIGEVVAVVTRYYGGVKLGTGGLARAYAGAVQSGLAITPIRERVDYGSLHVTVSYAHCSIVKHLLARHEAAVLAEQFTEQVTLDLQAPLPQLAALRAAIANATSGQAVFSGGAL
jgi:uncharacterized YigZ family protein